MADGDRAPFVRCLLQTGQRGCYDSRGEAIPCPGSGQDAAFRIGLAWPRPRFEVRGETVYDALTGLCWSRDANPAGFPLTWVEAFDRVGDLNRRGFCGHDDWRLPNRRELRSLVSHQTRRPALPEGHPFRNVFSGWYWSSTSAAISPSHAWYVHMEGARMFYGGKDQSFLLWPVRGAGKGVLPATGQERCFDPRGRELPCRGSGQDGELRMGRRWPQPRFEPGAGGIVDRLTGLVWHRRADLADGVVSWAQALDTVARLEPPAAGAPWRLPNINELESLVDCERHSPALPAGADFEALRPAYWSSTTSLFEPDWAWALYLDAGAVGVGQKKGAHFHVWAVR